MGAEVASERPIRLAGLATTMAATISMGETEDLMHGPHRRREQFTLLPPELAQRVRASWDETDDILAEHDRDVRARRIPELPIIPTSPREAWGSMPYAHLDDIESDGVEHMRSVPRSWSVLSADKTQGAGSDPVPGTL